jgi:hypothetical protein
MQALDFWKTVVADEAGLLERFVALLADRSIPYCVIGGQAVSAYVEPLVSLDLDVVVATADLSRLVAAAGADGMRVEAFPHSVNLTWAASALRVQVQTDPRYPAFVERARPLNVLGLTLPVASVEDVLQGKVWAALDASRRASKRQKDFADIARLLEAFPDLRPRVPAEIQAKLL